MPLLLALLIASAAGAVVSYLTYRYPTHAPRGGHADPRGRRADGAGDAAPRASRRAVASEERSEDCHGPRAHSRPRAHLRRGDRARAARVPRPHRLGPARHRLERGRVGGGPRHRVVDGRPRDAHAPGRHAHRPRPRPRARDRGDHPRAEPLDRPLRARGDPRPEPDHERPQGRVRPSSADDQPDRGDARPVLPLGPLGDGCGVLRSRRARARSQAAARSPRRSWRAARCSSRCSSRGRA